MSGWLRGLAWWVEYNIERPLSRVRGRVRDWLFPPPALLGPQPTVDFMWRRMQADMRHSFEEKNDAWEWFDDLTGR